MGNPTSTEKGAPPSYPIRKPGDPEPTHHAAARKNTPEEQAGLDAARAKRGLPPRA